MPGQSGAANPITSLVLHIEAQRPAGLQLFDFGTQHIPEQPIAAETTVPSLHFAWQVPPNSAHPFVPASTGCAPLGTQHLLFGSHSAS
jgi:hypothetical protein